MTHEASSSLDLRFYDPKQPGLDRVPAAALAQSLEAVQRLAYLAAMRREGRTPGRRIRPAADLQSRYRLMCQPPRRGSYISPVQLEGTDLLASSEASSVMDDLQKLFAAVATGTEAELAATIPDETWRRFMLDALERLPPPPSTGFELEIRRYGESLLDTRLSREFVDRLARRSSGTAVRGSVVGEFKRIDFSKNEITIRHQLTGRDLNCVYEPHVEESLLDHPRDLLLVSGSVTRDDVGKPLSIEDVDHIEPVDLTPVEIRSIAIGNQRIEPLEPISAPVTFDESDLTYGLQIPALSVSLFAETRELLTFALEDEIVVLWKCYVSESDERLTPSARALKERIRAAFKTVIDAT